jgi:low molecular weight protein-tyrosine phosphatase
MAHAVLFVCTANICRSPMAAAVLRSMVAQAAPRAALRIASAGTHDYHLGMPAFPAAVAAAHARGYDIGEHAARRVGPGDFDGYDVILAMDRYNVATLGKLAPTRCKGKIELLLEYGERFHGAEVPDPYGGEVRDFERALDLIEDGCRGLVRLLVR